ncbi:hypothetical protein VY88_26275 [Azospirillum thiophilum]|uniref:Uncharacterized protein n=1 Tax=Azospirillum thiophilum TaxID=528244 RepID=A0AAC8W4T6_9PROT|nr:hypothetical protein AL072_29185 [Azospirillum thiophilum]KJR62438.1 hypothetical protein VY88_26275 [Azospirillum thiophilum]
MMGTAAVLDENLALVATLTGGDWALPLENLLDPTVKETVARCVSGDPADAWFDVVWAGPGKRFDTLVIAGGSIDPRATFRLTWYSHPTDRSAGSVLQGGPDAAWLRVYPSPDRRRDRSYYAGNYLSGGQTARDLAGKTPQLLHRPAVSPRCKALRVEIDNRGRPLDLGHLFIARAFRPDWPHNWGMVLEPVDNSPVDATPGGRRIPDRRPAPVRKTVRFDDLTEDEAMRFHDLGLRAGKTDPLLMIEDITQGRHQWRRVKLATLEDGAIPVTQTEGDLWSATLKLLEIIG